MDKLDSRILDLLQTDGALTAAAIAERIGLSKAPCWRRIKKLQDDGIIKQTVALLDAHALNLGTTVFVTLKTAKHNAAWFEQFVRATLPLIYGRSATDALSKIPDGGLAAQGDLFAELPQKGMRIPVGDAWTIRLFPETRPGNDGPLVVRYRVSVVPNGQ